MSFQRRLQEPGSGCMFPRWMRAVRRRETDRSCAAVGACRAEDFLETAGPCPAMVPSAQARLSVMRIGPPPGGSMAGTNFSELVVGIRRKELVLHEPQVHERVIHERRP